MCAPARLAVDMDLAVWCLCVCVFRLNNRETNPIERDDVAHSFQTDFSLEIHAHTSTNASGESETESQS